MEYRIFKIDVCRWSIKIAPIDSPCQGLQIRFLIVQNGYELMILRTDEVCVFCRRFKTPSGFQRWSQIRTNVLFLFWSNSVVKNGLELDLFRLDEVVAFFGGNFVTQLVVCDL